jgi:uncharacterized Zn-binding protein involved in type VI secretion
MAKAARVTDPTSHGGAITAGSPTVKVDGLAVARDGDAISCPIHGAGTITSGSPVAKADGIAIARVGDSTSCGATISSGSPTTEVG